MKKNLHFGNIKMIILFNLVLFGFTSYSQESTIFENTKYILSATSTGSDVAIVEVENKITKYNFDIFNPVLVDTNAFFIIGNDRNNNLCMLDFEGKYCLTIPIKSKKYGNTNYPQLIDSIFIDNNILFIYWNEFIDDPRYKPNTITKFKIE